MKKLIFILLLISTLSSCAATKKDSPYKMEILVTQSDVIWGFDFLKDGRILFTERSGKLFSYDPKTKKTTTITGVPKVRSAGQGGLLDLRVHPESQLIYLTYSAPLDGDNSATTLASAKLEGSKLTQVKKLFQTEKNANDYHFGSRIEFDDKHVFITSGERGTRMKVQELSNTFGKMIRLNLDGSIPKDNPYVKTKNARKEIWSVGIRSPQGLSLRPGTSELWMAEMGPKGGDELNLIEPGANYGWPVVTYGTEYDGPKIGEGTEKKGMQGPVAYWVPSISPSAMTFWKGDIWLANLSSQQLRQLKLQGQKVVEQIAHFEHLDWRFRNVRPGPEGYLYFSTDEGKLGRLVD